MTPFWPIPRTGTAWQRPTTDKSPRLQAQETDYGFRYAALRRPIQNAGSALIELTGDHHGGGQSIRGDYEW